MSEKLTQVDHLLECYRRGILDRKEQSLLENKLKGDEAEDVMEGMLVERLPYNWVLLRNVWLENYRNTEVDFLVVTSKFWWSIEVKNYIGPFEYKNNRCYNKGQQIRDEIAANHNRIGVLESIGAKLGNNSPKIISSMVFMNNECDVILENQPDFPIIMRYRTRRHINEVIGQYNYPENSDYPEKALQLIVQHRIESPIKLKQLNQEDFHRLRKGIYCSHCNGYTIQYYYHSIVCSSCQHREPKATAVLRTTCDLGMLFYHDPRILTMGNIYQFVGENFSKNSINRILSRYLTIHNKYKWAYYHNHGLPLSKISP